MSWRVLLRPLRRTQLGARLAASPYRPHYWRPSIDAARVLWFKYGHLQSVRSKQAVDGAGQPVPWYTYPAVEYLKQFDFSGKSVFEYGSGNSTLFWSRRAATVVSVEDEEDWFDQMRSRVPPNCTMRHESDLRRYVNVIHEYPEGFDVIVVDGPARGFCRLKCARAALEHLRPGGFVILDNADWLPETAKMLRQSGLLQVDMSGFIPIEGITETTSFFFRRDCDLRPVDRQPVPSAGGRLRNWDVLTPLPGRSVVCEDHTFYGVSHEQDFVKATPSGARRLRLIVHMPAEGKHSVTILDQDADRIVLLGDSSGAARDLKPDIQRILDMDWATFQDFVRSHPYRFYVPE